MAVQADKGTTRRGTTVRRSADRAEAAIVPTYSENDSTNVPKVVHNMERTCPCLGNGGWAVVESSDSFGATVPILSREIVSLKKGSSDGESIALITYSKSVNTLHRTRVWSATVIHIVVELQVAYRGSLLQSPLQ
jgi:hypothetical protein